jgi:hypothetical protein
MISHIRELIECRRRYGLTLTADISDKRQEVDIPICHGDDFADDARIDLLSDCLSDNER